MTVWAEPYMLLVGWRCWDLLRRVMADRAGIELPVRNDVDAADLHAVAAALDEGRRTGPWLPVEPGAERELDVVLIRDLVAGEMVPAHVGIVTRPGYVLHVAADLHPAHLPFRDGRGFRADRTLRHRVDSIYRHEALL